MLINARVAAALPSQDYERAKSWYKEKLGLSPTEETSEAAYYNCADGTRFFIFPSSGKASAEYTQVGFEVSDIEAEVAELKQAGVVFEEYEIPGLKTEHSITNMLTERSAWLKDSEGNLIALFERSSA